MIIPAEGHLSPKTVQKMDLQNLSGFLLSSNNVRLVTKLMSEVGKDIACLPVFTTSHMPTFFL